jgi:sugar diacid utilization regulator
LSVASLSELHNEIRDRVLAQLERDAAAVGRRMADASRAEVAEYAAVRDAGFAAERGARRARELLPLDALLEAYLIGQRTVWESIVAAAGASPDGMRVAQELTGVTFVYTHAINVAIAAAYMRESQALASGRERGRRDLIDALLSGHGDTASHARRAEALGLRPDGAHMVVVATAGDDQQAVRPATQALALGDSARSFVVPRHDELVAVVPVYARRGPGELRAELERAAERLQRTHGVELRAAVSAVCTGLGEITRGYAEARRALRHAPAVGAIALEDVGLFGYLAAGADATAERLIPDAVRRLVAADARQAGALGATLRAYADCDLNVARAAERLVVHPNTVHYRLRRVADLSGRDPRRFAELVELLTALRLLAREAPHAAI